MQYRCGLFFTNYRQESRLFPSMFVKICLAVFAVLLLASPLYLSIYHMSVLNLVNIAIIASVSLNLLTGCCGQISLGHGAFVGVGAYATAWFNSAGVHFLPALLLGGAVTALVGIFFGLPSLRLKGIYLAIATLAAQFILEYVFLHWEAVTNGAHSVRVAAPSLFGFVFDTDTRMFYLTLVIAVFVVYAASNLMRSKPGRAFVAIRDHYLSAEIVGVNLFAYKLKAFAVSSFMAGMAGGLWAFTFRSISPEPTFDINLSISYLAMIIIGGLGSVKGAVYGAVFITLLNEVLVITAGWIGEMFPSVMMKIIALPGGVFGLVIILFLIFEPEGLSNRWRLIKSYFKLYPFAH